MTRLFRLLLPAAAPFVAALCLSTANAKAPVPAPPSATGHRQQFDPKKFMPVSELRPGMRGYALTVFKGTKIEKFHVEILGVISKFNEGKDYILFRALDGPSVTEHLNIAHGMSGSPIYINGRLVGAISMGIPGTEFPRDPIALATPIEDMFDSWSPDLPSKPSSIGATADTGAAGTGLTVAGQNFQQIDLPVSASGFSLSALSRLRTALSPYHLDVMAGGGGGADADNPLAKGASLVPGAAVGVSLVQGDMDLTATGTVTYRDGNRVLLFGHPFTDFGPVDAAMTTAYVVNIFPSFQDSVKLGSPIKTVGRISQDRPFSVGGLIGSMPQMVPMTVDVNDLSIKRHKIFHMQVINHPLLTSQLVTQLADAAIAQVHGQPGDSVATVTMDADVEQIGHVKRTNTFYDAISIDQSAVGDLDSLLRLLSSNPFYPLALKSLKMGVTIENRHDTAEVDHIFVKQGKYAPGDTVSVGVVLKPFKRDPVTRYVSLKIPETTQTGALTLTVKGGGDGGGGISLGGGIILLRPSEPTAPAGNVAQLVKQFTETPRNNEIVARLLLPTNAINIAGEKLTTLPPTLADVMQSTHSSGLKTERDEVKVIQATPYITSGSQALTITIEKKALGDPAAIGAATPAAPAPADGSAPATTDTASADDGSDDTSVTSSLALPTAGDNLTAMPIAFSATGTSRIAATTKTGGASAPAAAATAPAGAAPAKAPPAVTTVGRLASVWRQGTTTDFAAGTLQNVSVTSDGDVRLSAALTKVAETGETYLWSLLPDGQGNVYAGTGDHGNVYRFDASGKPTLFFATGQLEVTALARDAQGSLYAGTAPHGIVYKIGPDGKGKPFFTAQEKYVTALVYDESQARLLVATGGGTGCVYAVPASGVAPTTPWFASPEAHLLSLTLDKSGNVYAGSSPDGIVYKIIPSGATSVFYDAPEQSISALATDSGGNVYAGTTPKGLIYKITPDGSAKVLSDRATSSVLSLQTDGSDNLYACAGNTIYRISPDETVQSFVAPTDEQFLSLAVDHTNGQVYTGTSTVGSLYAIGASGDLHGKFVSTVHDAGLPAHWGTISWTAGTPAGTQIALQTRSGDVERPDASWSDWSSAYTAPTGQKITSPPGRYLQYQATLTGASAAITSGSVPRLREVTVYYLPRNQAPTVHLTSPAEGDAFSKTATLRWTAGDPDKDTLTFDLSYSSDGGKTWTLLPKKSPAPATTPAAAATGKTPPASATAIGPVTDQEVAAEVKKMQDSLAAHPELPSSVRAQMLAQAPAMARQLLTIQHAQAAAATPDSTTASNLKDMSYTWDTTTVPDGVYQIEIVASDKTSNPQGALTAKDTSPSFTVANTLPTVLAGTPTVGSDKSVTVRGTVTTPLAFVKAVQAKVDGGDPLAAIADDGLFDSTSESYTLITAPLSSGAHTIEVQAVDVSGNMASAKVNVQVP